MGRPSKLTRDRWAQILELLASGASRRAAARATGIDPATLTKWLRRGEQARYPESRYRQFLDSVLEAEAHPSLQALKTDQERMLADPDLAWRFIERRDHDFSGPTPRTIELKFD